MFPFLLFFCKHLATSSFASFAKKLFSHFQASSFHEYFYLQGYVFCVFVLICLIDSNMGFLNGLSSDLFPQELMTQNELKNAWWEFKSFWFEGTGFGAFYTKVILKMSKSANEVNMEYACVSQGNCVSFFSTSMHIWSLELLRQVSTASLLPVVFFPHPTCFWK